jgi:hypothetical protein
VKQKALSVAVIVGLSLSLAVGGVRGLAPEQPTPRRPSPLSCVPRELFLSGTAFTTVCACAFIAVVEGAESTAAYLAMPDGQR